MNKAEQIKQIEARQQFKTATDEDTYFESSPDVPAELFYYYYKTKEVKRFPRPSVTIDLVGLRYLNDRLQLVTIKRKHRPYKDHWALPGGFVNYEETINNACLREVKEETNIDLDDRRIIRLPAVSAPHRDPRMWVITNPNIVLFTPQDIKQMQAKAGDDAGQLKWQDLKLVDDKLKINANLAFDHYKIVQNALLTLKADFASRQGLPRISALLGNKATTRDLADLFHNFTGSRFDLSNLHAKYEDYLIDTGKKVQNGGKGGPRARVFKLKLDL